MQKAASDEVAERDIPAEEWPDWRQADAEEWAKIEASGAVKVLMPERSREVCAELAASGQLDRIIASRFCSAKRSPASSWGNQVPSRVGGASVEIRIQMRLIWMPTHLP